MERLLGHVDGVAAFGELKNFLTSGFMENLLCGCGEPFGSCAFWQEVTQKAYAGRYDGPDALREAISLRNSFRVRRLLMNGDSASRHRLRLYINEQVAPLYRALWEATEGNVIVDASNVGWYLLVLARCEDLDLHVLHLVRDSRAVAYSYSRRKLRKEFDGSEVYMPRHSSVTSTKLWVINNFVPLMLSRFIPENRYMLMRYEEFARNPKPALREVLGFVGLGDMKLPFSGERVARLGLKHAVLGNPMRFEEGDILIKPDESWKECLGWLDHLVAKTLSYPLLRALYPGGN